MPQNHPFRHSDRVRLQGRHRPSRSRRIPLVPRPGILRRVACPGDAVSILPERRVPGCPGCEKTGERRSLKARRVRGSSWDTRYQGHRARATSVMPADPIEPVPFAHGTSSAAARARIRHAGQIAREAAWMASGGCPTSREPPVAREAYNRPRHHAKAGRDRIPVQGRPPPRRRIRSAGRGSGGAAGWIGSGTPLGIRHCDLGPFGLSPFRRSDPRTRATLTAPALHGRRICSGKIDAARRLPRSRPGRGPPAPDLERLLMGWPAAPRVRRTTGLHPLCDRGGGSFQAYRHPSPARTMQPARSPPRFRSMDYQPQSP